MTGAAPIWNADMVAALAGVKPDWYTQPTDVIQQGAAATTLDFFLPGTSPGSTICYFYGPAPSPAPTGTPANCVYGGTQAPPDPIGVAVPRGSPQVRPRRSPRAADAPGRATGGCGRAAREARLSDRAWVDCPT